MGKNKVTAPEAAQAASQESKTGLKKFEIYQICSDVVKVLLLIAAAWIALHGEFWEKPRLDREAKQKEFSIKVFEEQKSVYFDACELMATIQHQENLEDIKAPLVRLKILSDGKYLLVFPKDANGPNKSELSSFVLAVEAFMKAMGGNELQPKIDSRYKMKRECLFVQNSMRASLSANFPQWDISIARGRTDFLRDKETEDALRWEVEQIERRTREAKK